MMHQLTHTKYSYYEHLTPSHKKNGASITRIGQDIAQWQSIMVQWVVRLILHGGPTSYFSFQPVLHDWFNKLCGMYYSVCGMMHTLEPLLLIRKSSPCSSSSGFTLTLSEWSFTMSNAI